MPIESMIRKNQEEYYKVIDKCNEAGNSTEFIEFMLKMIDVTIDEMITTQKTTQKTTQETTQEKIIEMIKNDPKITQIEMSEKLNITRDGVAYNIKALKEKEIIEREGSDKDGYWKVN